MKVSMKPAGWLFAAWLTGFASTFALAAPPSVESLDRLFAARGDYKMFQTLFESVPKRIQQAADTAANAGKPGDEDRRTIEIFKQKHAALLQEKFSPDAMRTLQLQTYTEAFTQDDIDGAIAYYESPAGRAFVSKQADLMQKLDAFVQPMLKDLLARTNELMREARAEARAGR
jgi:uncharacterized protein